MKGLNPPAVIPENTLGLRKAGFFYGCALLPVAQQTEQDLQEALNAGADNDLLGRGDYARAS